MGRVCLRQLTSSGDRRFGWNVPTADTLCQSLGQGPVSALWLLGRSALRRTHRLGHAEEDRDALAAAARREHLAGVLVATVDVLPVVHHPNVARRRDGKVRLHLQAAAHIAAGWGDLV